MPEEMQSPEEKARSIDAELLRQQAEEIRQSTNVRTEAPSGVVSRWAQAAYLAVLLLVISCVIFLLISRGSRLRLLSGLVQGWSKVSSQETAEVFKLPPPPPKAVEPKVVLQGAPTLVFRSGGAASVRPVPQETKEAPEQEPPADAVQDESKPPAPPEKTAGSNSAYELLVKTSEVARKLANNGFPDLQFKEWKPVRSSPPDFWINVVAVRAGQSVEFVWAVNTESGTVRALSQNARDLERK